MKTKYLLNYEVQIQNFEIRNLKNLGDGKATSGYARLIGSLTDDGLTVLLNIKESWVIPSLTNSAHFKV